MTEEEFQKAFKTPNCELSDEVLREKMAYLWGCVRFLQMDGVDDLADARVNDALLCQKEFLAKNTRLSIFRNIVNGDKGNRQKNASGEKRLHAGERLSVRRQQKASGKAQNVCRPEFRKPAHTPSVSVLRSTAHSSRTEYR